MSQGSRAASSGNHPGTMSLVNDQFDKVGKAVQRVETERDIYRQALREIVVGRFFFGDRAREIANKALMKAVRL